MATGAAIVAGTKAVGGVVGGINANNKSNEAMANQSASMEQGLQAMEQYMTQAGIHGQDALEYAQGMMTDWEDTFGGIEQNLSDYYSNLDPVKYAENYKSDLNANIDKQIGQMNETMAASGLQTAGMKQQTAKEAAFAKATGGAQADLMADDKVASMQQGFVNTGASKYANAASQNMNAHGNLANLNMNAGSSIGSMYGNQANMYGNQAAQYGADAGGFMKGGLEGASELAGMLE